jgi:hypothetical protein
MHVVLVQVKTHEHRIIKGSGLGKLRGVEETGTAQQHIGLGCPGIHRCQVDAGPHHTGLGLQGIDVHLRAEPREFPLQRRAHLRRRETQRAPIDAYIDNHARALITNHVLDAVSSDRHTVKPWFRGRRDFSPTILELADRGFPLIGARLEFPLIGARL